MTAPDKIALYKSGMTKFTQQDFTGALADFNQALELDPQFADVHQSMAHCYEKLGDLDQDDFAIIEEQQIEGRAPGAPA